MVWLKVCCEACKIPDSFSPNYKHVEYFTAIWYYEGLVHIKWCKLVTVLGKRPQCYHQDYDLDVDEGEK